MGLVALAEQLKKSFPAMEKIGEAMVDDLRLTFRQQTDPAGRPWKPLNRSYAASKRGPRILEEKGHLRDSLASQPRRTSVTIGPKKGSPSYKYQKIHQFGGTAGMGKKIPARPYVGATTRHVTIIESVLLTHLRANPAAPAAAGGLSITSLATP